MTTTTEQHLNANGFEHYLSANNDEGAYVHIYTNTKATSPFNGEVVEIDDDGLITDHYSQFRGNGLKYGK